MLSKKNRFLGTWLLVLLALSYLLPFVAPQDPVVLNLDNRFLPPSLVHLFGTDDLGRDVLSRVLHGFSITVMVSLAALISSLCIGVFLGSVAGYFYKRWLDWIFNWITSLIISIPFLLIMASILSLTKPDIIKAYIILTCIMWVNIARLVRADVIQRIHLDYVVAARAFGYPEWSILIRGILPASMASAILFSISYLPEIIALEAGLSFIGLGVQPPDPGLGKMIFDGLNYIYTAPWIALFPALALFMLVLSINIVQGFLEDK